MKISEFGRRLCGSIVLWSLCSAGHATVISDENAKPGTAAWKISNPVSRYSWKDGTGTRAEVEGYASATSVPRGQTITFFVNTSEASYSAVIYRLGWYGGTGGRQVWPATGVSWMIGKRQTIPAPSATTGLAECNWTPSFSVTVPNTSDPTDWATGVYVVKLTGGISGKQSYIPFTVRDDARAAPYFFQNSVNTWQAYNSWGGKSLYGFNSTAGVPAVKVSFNRPYDGGRGAGDLFSWELNALRFFEREGYDVAYGTNVDVHTNNALLGNRKAFLSVGHDEYWTYQMRNIVQARQSVGLHLGFLSSNSVYWSVRYEPSTVNGAANRTIVGYKANAATQDPYATDTDATNNKYITGKFIDFPTKFGVNDWVARPENSLMGVMFRDQPVNGDIVVSNPLNWVFANTGVTYGSKLEGLLGYEIDSKVSNAYSPRYLKTLAESPYVLANDATKTGVSHMTIFTAPSGSTTFATGSMQWAWGLDDYGHRRIEDYCTSATISCCKNNYCASPVAQQVTRNVMARFLLPALLTPSNVTATGQDAQVNLSWTATTGAVSYDVYRSNAPISDDATPYRTGITSTSFADRGVTNSQLYYYKVAAANGVAQSVPSAEVSARPLAVPAAPTGLTATNLAGNSVKLTWVQSTSPYLKYNAVYRATSATGTYTRIGTIPAGTTYTDSTVASRTAYWYKVVAININITYSAVSNAAAITTD